MSPKKLQQRGPGRKNVSTSEKARKQDEGIFSAFKPKVQKVESDEENSDFECFDKSNGKPVDVDVDKDFTERDPALALLPNRPEEEETNNNGMGMEIIACAAQTECLNHRNGWVVCRISESK